MLQEESTITAKLHRLLTVVIDRAEAEIEGRGRPVPIAHGVVELRVADAAQLADAYKHSIRTIQTLADHGKEYELLVGIHEQLVSSYTQVATSKRKKVIAKSGDFSKLCAEFSDVRRRIEVCQAAMLATLGELHATSRIFFDGIEVVQLCGPVTCEVPPTLAQTPP